MKNKFHYFLTSHVLVNYVELKKNEETMRFVAAGKEKKKKKGKCR